MRTLALAVFLIFAAAACTGLGGTSKATPSGSPAGTPLRSPSGGLDAEVAMPSGFPADVPIYPGARLTAAANFQSSGQVTWGMEWETLDSVDKVKAYYASRLSQGDWTISSSGSSSGVYAAVFARKSNSKSSGILGIDGTSGVTKISMSFQTVA